MRQLCVVLAAALVAACLVGCGGGGDYSSPKATATTMWDAAKAGNKDAVMACFSKDCREKMAEMEKLFNDLPKEIAEAAKGKQQSVTDEMMAAAKKSKLEFGAEKIDGEKATLEVITDGKKDTMDFVKEGSAWKIHIPQIAAMDMQQIKQGLKKGLESIK